MLGRSNGWAKKSIRARILRNHQQLAHASGLVRSKGYCWLDTRLNLVFSWQQAGPNLCIEPVGTWGTATPRSEVVLIGIDLDAPALLRSFEQAVVTDAEAAALLPS